MENKQNSPINTRTMKKTDSRLLTRGRGGMRAMAVCPAANEMERCRSRRNAARIGTLFEATNKISSRLSLYPFQNIPFCHSRQYYAASVVNRPILVRVTNGHSDLRKATSQHPVKCGRSRREKHALPTAARLLAYDNTSNSPSHRHIHFAKTLILLGNQRQMSTMTNTSDRSGVS